MGVGGSVQGGAQVRAMLEKYGQKIEQAVADGVNETALKIHGTAVQKCPVDTGRLRSSIGVRKTASAGDPSAEVSTDVEYAEHVEYGTVHNHANPFMGIAVEVEGKNLDDIITARVRRVVG